MTAIAEALALADRLYQVVAAQRVGLLAD